MRKSRKYFIKTLSRQLTKDIFKGVEQFLKTPYFRKRLVNHSWENKFLATMKLGDMLYDINTRRRTLFKLSIIDKFPLYVEYNPDTTDMGSCLPFHHIRINLANIDNYKELRTTIIHEMTHLFDERDIKDYSHYSYENNPIEISAREMEDWFLNNFFFKNN